MHELQSCKQKSKQQTSGKLIIVIKNYFNQRAEKHY
jgi:hypothetical protein